MTPMLFLMAATERDLVAARLKNLDCSPWLHHMPFDSLIARPSLPADAKESGDVGYGLECSALLRLGESLINE